eukprot:scaffold6369_cov113-Isochrysis_galbana.AAC.3
MATSLPRSRHNGISADGSCPARCLVGECVPHDGLQLMPPTAWSWRGFAAHSGCSTPRAVK